MTNTLFININELRGVVWLGRVHGKYCLKKIEETPHYLYLNKKKEYYENKKTQEKIKITVEN